MKQKKLKASMTVEAAFLIPVVIFVIFALMYLTFYLHDRVRMEKVLETALGKGDFLVVQRGATDGGSFEYAGINEKSNWGYFQSAYKEQEEEIIRYLNAELENGFFVFDKEKVVCEIDGFVIKIEINMKNTITLNPVKHFLGDEAVVRLERERVFHNPEEIIRVYEGLKIIMSYAEDAEFAKKYVAKNRTALEKE